ncbi:DUF7002 family protein [Loktanella sp. DJP18]|uniref:DUF7002 family protein n=1 Tax=Loktanella sp. DJP18 TaxID=3409788 RepID=UPI003BB52008
MTRDDFIRLVGPSLFHVTLVSNLAGITARGLLRPAEAARQAGFAPVDVALRKEPETIVAHAGPMTLNHQRPLLAGRDQAKDFLSSGSLKDWAMQLDERIFFWPRAMRQTYLDSLGERAPLHVLEIDAGGLFDIYADHLDLAPINSGAALRRPARRGPWLYVPATATVAAFRTNRIKRDLVKSRDSVAEVSLRCDISSPQLSVLLTKGEA